MPPRYTPRFTEHAQSQLNALPIRLAVHAVDAVLDLAEADDPAGAALPHPDYPSDAHMRLVDTGRVRITVGIYEQLLIIEAMAVTPNT